MQIDYALILCAGMGTRMGEIGKVIPKVLWPIYAKTLLELQIRYCEDLGIKKIFVNTHYLHDEIVNFFKESNFEKKVTILHEKVLLDSGGAIHNLAARPEVNYAGNLLLVNGDQFLFFDEGHWKEAEAKISLNRAVLFGIKVDKNASYNQTIIVDGNLKEIRKNTEKNNDYVTYSGLGILNLSGLKPVPGISSFFETVANFKTESVAFVTPDTFEYWDFGTAEVYVKNIFRLNHEDQAKCQMAKFLHKHSAFSMRKELFMDEEKNAIDLEASGKLCSGCIHGKNILQKI